MLSKPSSALTVFEEKVLVVAREGWDSSAEQCCSCCARSDEIQQSRKQFRNTQSVAGYPMASEVPAMSQIMFVGPSASMSTRAAQQIEFSSSSRYQHVQ